MLSQFFNVHQTLSRIYWGVHTHDARAHPFYYGRDSYEPAAHFVGRGSYLLYGLRSYADKDRGPPSRPIRIRRHEKRELGDTSARVGHRQVLVGSPLVLLDANCVSAQRLGSAQQLGEYSPLTSPSAVP